MDILKWFSGTNLKGPSDIKHWFIEGIHDRRETIFRLVYRGYTRQHANQLVDAWEKEINSK